VVEEVVEQETLQEIQVDLVEAVVSMTLEDHIQDHQELADKVMQVEHLTT
jgi:hypothetical protein